MCMVIAKSGGNELHLERHECGVGERQFFSRYYVWKFGIYAYEFWNWAQRGTSIDALSTWLRQELNGYVPKESVDGIMTRES